MDLGTDLLSSLEARSPTAWIQAHIKRNELNQPFTLYEHQKEVLRLAFNFDQGGRLPWDTVIYSAPKKSGKTSILAILTLWWAMCHEWPNEIFIVANDYEQAQSRVYATIQKLLKFNPINPQAVIMAKQIELGNGTVMKPLASDYASAAGSAHGLVAYDELWGYTSERSQRLYEELTPIPTRRNSLRLIGTYAGFERESELLFDLYKQGVGPDEHEGGQARRLHPTLPIYGNREARIFCYWDHEPRMPWQTEAYYRSQRRQLRPNAYRRLHLNEWTSTEDTFITAEQWDRCVDPDHHAVTLPMRDIEVAIGCDAGIRHDSAAVVACAMGEREDHSPVVIVVRHRIWAPTTEDINLEDTIEAEVSRWAEQFSVASVVVDPWQMASTVQRWRAAGLSVVEMPSSPQSLTRITTILWDLLQSGSIILYDAPDLKQHALNAVATETPRGLRLSKEKISKKIDGLMALGLACVGLTELEAKPKPRFSAVGS